MREQACYFIFPRMRFGILHRDLSWGRAMYVHLRALMPRSSVKLSRECLPLSLTCSFGISPSNSSLALQMKLLATMFDFLAAYIRWDKFPEENLWTFVWKTQPLTLPESVLCYTWLVRLRSTPSPLLQLHAFDAKWTTWHWLALGPGVFMHTFTAISICAPCLCCVFSLENCRALIDACIMDMHMQNSKIRKFQVWQLPSSI